MNFDANTVVTCLSLIISGAVALGAIRSRVDKNDEEVKSLRKELHELSNVVGDLRVAVSELSGAVRGGNVQQAIR